MGAIDRVFRGRRPSQERALTAIIAGLWRNGEQGVWYDSTDLSTMFLDPAGAAPIYMPGQGQPDPWIGLQLDKRLGLVRGPERLTNGDFASTAGWVESGAGVALSAAAGELQITSASPLGAYQQPNNFVVGRWYVVTGQIRVGSAASVSIRTVAVGSSLGTTVAESQVVTSSAFVGVSYIFQATNTANAIYLRVGTTNSTAFFKSLSVRELPGNHRWQGTATSRAVLSARYNICTNTENVAAWTKVNGDTGAVPVITPDAGLAPNGTMTADRCVMERGSGNTTAAFSLVYAGGTFPTAAQATRSIWLKSYSGAAQSVLLYDGSQAVGRVVSVTADWQQFFLTGGTAATGTSLVIGTRGGDPGTYYASGGQQSLDLLVWGIDIRAANDGIGLPSYQRVIDANTYDTAGFPLYRKPDGVDDWMQTGVVDFSGTDKVTVVAATRKLSDSANQTILESSTAADANAGSFFLRAAAGGNPNYQFYVKSTTGQAWTESAVAAPDSSVMLLEVDLAAGTRKVRRNGTLSFSGVFPGGGTLGNYPLYFDRRAGTSLPSAARDYGTLIVGRLLTGPETAAVEKLLRQKSRAY